VALRRERRLARRREELLHGSHAGRHGGSPATFPRHSPTAPPSNIGVLVVGADNNEYFFLDEREKSVFV